MRTGGGLKMVKFEVTWVEERECNEDQYEVKVVDDD